MSLLRATRTFAIGLAFSFVPTVAFAAGKTIDLGSGVTLELVEIPAGQLAQGSAAGSPGHGDDEGARTVAISQPFLIGKSPVTNAQWARFSGATRYLTEAEKGTSGGFGWNGSQLVQDKKYNWQNTGSANTPDTPVTIVTYADALAFDAWLAQKAGFEVRLPTEAEFEYAARANAKTRFSWGDDPSVAETHAWFAKNAGAGAKPVGQKPANAFGLVDTSGNVWEWCLDWYGPIPPAAVTDPRIESSVVWEKSDKPRRVLKGGSWRTDDREKLRPATRYRADPGSRNADFGFRVVGIPGNRPGPAPAPVPSAAPSGGPGSSDHYMIPESQRQSSGGCGFIGLFGAVSAFIVLVWFLIRRSNAKKAQAAAAPAQFAGWGQGGGSRKLAPGSPYRARIGADGFWIDAPAGTNEGDQIAYVAQVGGRRVDGRATLTRSQKGTFVYTGTPPTDVSFTDYFVASQLMNHPPTRTDRDFSSSSSSGSSGWPSAY